MFSSASQVSGALTALFILLERCGESREEKTEGTPEEEQGKPHRQIKGCRAHFAEGRNSHIHWDLLSKQQEFLADTTDFSGKMFVLIKDRERKKVKRKRGIKRTGAMQKQEARAEAVCLPHLWKPEGTHQGNSNSEGQLRTFAPYRPPGEFHQEKSLPFPRSPWMVQQGDRTTTEVLTSSYRRLQAKHVLIEATSSQFCNMNSLGISVESRWNKDTKNNNIPPFPNRLSSHDACLSFPAY